MSNEVLDTLAERLAQYVVARPAPAISIIFHGGEPLLAGASRIVDAARRLRRVVPRATAIHFSIQTNGTLLTAEGVRAFAEERISVSLSIDGAQDANDRHRLDHSGRSTFRSTIAALELLESNRQIYGGVITVIDPRVEPEHLFEFLAPRHPPGWELLLPDAHHECIPPGRESDPHIYERWLIRAFDLWFDRYGNIPLRFFDAVLAGCVGLSSDTDTFGFGTANLLTIETDGTYHALDVLKITEDNATSLGLNVFDHAIAEAAGAPKMREHGRLLSAEGLGEGCIRCPEMTICGGGAVPHRYSRAGMMNPTVYCSEMLALIRHARNRMHCTLKRNP